MSGASLLSHLVSNDKRLAIGVPGQGKGIAETFDLIDTVLGADIPELNNAITGHATQFGILNRIKGDLLYGRGMALELGREADIGLLGIPYVMSQTKLVQNGRCDGPDSQTRRVLSAAPVAMRLPRGFQPMERMLLRRSRLSAWVS